MPQDDPVAAYLRKYGARQAAPAADPVSSYLQKYGSVAMPDTGVGASGRDATLQASPPGPDGVDPNDPAQVDSFLNARAQQARNAPPTTAKLNLNKLSPEHRRRAAFAQEPSTLSQVGVGLKRTGNSVLDFARQALRTSAQGYGAAEQYVMGGPEERSALAAEASPRRPGGLAERATGLLRGAITAPFEAGAGLGEVIRHPGEDWSTADITERAANVGLFAAPGLMETRGGRAFQRGWNTGDFRPPETPIPAVLPGFTPPPPGARPRPPVPEELTPIEPEPITPRNNPLSHHIDNAIEASKARIKALDEEIAAREAASRAREMDELRQLTDAELARQEHGQTPPEAANANAGMDEHIGRTAPSMLEKERVRERREADRRTQPAMFEGPNKRSKYLTGVPVERRAEAPLSAREGAMPGDTPPLRSIEEVMRSAEELSSQIERESEQGPGATLERPPKGADTRSFAERMREAPPEDPFLRSAGRATEPEPGVLADISTPEARAQAGKAVPPEEPITPEQEALARRIQERFNPARGAPEEPKARTLEDVQADWQAALEESRRTQKKLDMRFGPADEPIEVMGVKIGEPPDVRVPGMRGPTEQPPIPPRPTPIPADLSGLDARLEAERARNAELERQVESIPAAAKQTPAARAAQRARVEQERALARKANVHKERSLKAQLRAAERTLQQYPESDTRPIAAQKRAAALQAQQAAQSRLQEIADLRNRVPPKPRGKGGKTPEGGFLKLGATPATRTPAEAALDRQIGVGQLAAQTSVWRNPKRWVAEKWHQLVQAHVETSHTVGALERQATRAGAKLPLTQRPRIWMKAALDSPKRIAGALYGEGPGYFDDNGAWQQLDSPSLEAIIKPISGDVAQLQAVRRLLIAERAPEYAAQGLESGIPAAAAAEIVDRATPRVVAVATGMRNWLNATIEGAIKAGGLSRALFDAWQEKSPHYVSYEVAFPEEGGVPRGGTSVRGGVRPPAHLAKGSPLPKVDPFETIPDYGARWIRYTDLYRAVRSTLDLLTEQREKLGDYAVKIGEKALDAVDVVPQIGELLSDRSLRLEGDQVRLYNPKTNTMETWKLAPEVANGLRGLGAREWDFVTELLAAGKSGVQFGVTNNPLFGVANFLRDNTGRATMSGATNVPFERMKGANERYKTMGGGFGISEQSGGALDRLRGAMPGRGKLRSAQRARQRRAANLTGTVNPVVRVLRSFPEALKEMSVPFEEWTRGAEFRSQKAKGLSDLEAYINSQEVLGNFAEHGTAGYMRWLSHVTPFLNPRLQGTRAFLEAAKNRPVSTAVKAALTITVPTLIAYALNYDDDEIQELRTGPGGYNSMFLRDPRYYLHKAGVGPEEWANENTILKFPKPFLPGAIASTAVEHALDTQRGIDEHGLRRALSDLGNEMWQSSVNPVLGVPYALSTNKALGTGVPIVPEEQQGRVPEAQIGRHPNFSLGALSQALPTGMRFSPAKAHYGLAQFGGTAGRELPNLMDVLTQADKLPASRGFADVPFVSRFFARYPTSAVGSVRDVYDESRAPIAALTTLRQFASKGDAAGVLRTLDDYKDVLGTGARDEAFTQALSQLSDLAERFEYAQGMSRAERASQRDAMLRLSIQLAKSFHGQMHPPKAP